MASYRRLYQLQQVFKRSYAHKPPHVRLTQEEIIQVTPKVSSFDKKVHIKLQDLPHEAKVTVHASTKTEWRRRTVPFVSSGHYVTNTAGEVDLWKDASLGGSYTGVEPMGLFWSMTPSPSSPSNCRLVVKNVLSPVLYNFSVYLDHLSLKDIEQTGTGCPPVSAITLERQVMAPTVRRIPVKEGSVRGVLFLPPGEGPFPGVVDMFGLAGGLMECRAALLASNGFAVFALPFYQYKDLPQNLHQQTFEYFENAVNWVTSQPSVKQGGIGVIGTSGGGSFGTLVAWKCPQVKALIRVNSAGYVSLIDMYHKGELIRRPIKLDMDKTYQMDGGLVLKDGWLYTEADPIPLWERDVHLLVLVSDDDSQIASSAADLQYQQCPEDRRHLVEVVHYPGAGHLLEPPYTPLCRACYNPFFAEVVQNRELMLMFGVCVYPRPVKPCSLDQDLLWGGYAKEHNTAQEDSWRRILEFLGRHLPS